MRAENENIIKNMMEERVRVEKQVHELEKRNKALAESEARHKRQVAVLKRNERSGAEVRPSTAPQSAGPPREPDDELAERNKALIARFN